FTETRGNNFDFFFLGQFVCALNRLIPRMKRECEHSPMDRDKMVSIDVFHRLNCFFRVKMRVRPSFIVLPIFDKGIIKGSILLTNFFKVIAITRISAKINFFFLALNYPRGPESRVCIKEGAAREVLSRSGGKSNTILFSRFMPVELSDKIRFNSPAFKMS